MRRLPISLPFAALLAAAPTALAAQAPGSPEAVVLADANTLATAQLEPFLALYAPDAKIFGIPKEAHSLVGPVWTQMSGAENLRRAFTESFAKKEPQPRYEVAGMVSLGEIVVARMKISDPPSYDRPQFVMAVYRVRDGKIRDLWHVARDDGQPRPGIKPPLDVLRDLMAAGNRVDVEAWLALFDPTAKQFRRATETDSLANIPSKSAYDQASRRKAYEAAFAATPHGRADILATITIGDYVASRGSFTFPDRVINTLTIYRVSGGLIQDIWDVEQVVVQTP
jgi:hypothetical protein